MFSGDAVVKAPDYVSSGRMGKWKGPQVGTPRATFHFHALEKEMATHSSVLAWRIPGTGGLVGCRLWGRTESDMTEVT